MTEPMLVSLDVLGSDEELSAAARAAEPMDPQADAEGRDGTRSVTVRIDRAGRVDDVLITSWWREDLAPSELPEALIDAYRDAVAQTVTSGRPAGAAPAASPVQPIDPGLSDTEWFEAIRRSNDRTEETLERIERLQRQGPAERVVTGPAGIVRLHAEGGTVTTAEIDIHAALQESPSTVAADARAAFRAVR